jgi:hypothetical protein
MVGNQYPLMYMEQNMGKDKEDVFNIKIKGK